MRVRFTVQTETQIGGIQDLVPIFCQHFAYILKRFMNFNQNTNNAHNLECKYNFYQMGWIQIKLFNQFK